MFPQFPCTHSVCCDFSCTFLFCPAVLFCFLAFALYRRAALDLNNKKKKKTEKSSLVLYCIALYCIVLYCVDNYHAKRARMAVSTACFASFSMESAIATAYARPDVRALAWGESRPRTAGRGWARSLPGSSWFDGSTCC